MWPGQPYPLGASYDGIGTNFTLFSEVAERVELCLFDESGQRAAAGHDRGRRLRLALLPAGHRPRAALRLPRARAARPGDRPALQSRRSCCIDPYATALDGEVQWDPAVYGYPLGGDDRERYDADSAPFVPRSVVTNPWFEWGDDRQLRIPWHETVLYECHVKGLTMRHPEIPRRPAGHVRGHGAPGRHRAPHAARRHRGRADAGAPLHPRPPPGRQGPAQLLGLQLDRLPRPAQRLLGVGRRAGRLRVQVPGEDHARGRHRGHTRRGLQPHRGGQPPRPDAVLQGHRQPGLLPAGRRRPLLLRHHGHRQHAEHAPAARAAADHRLAALLGERDARGRLPFRPRRQPGPPVPRGRPAVRLLRPHPGGPGGEPGQAHRRAVGPRRGRLPGGQLPDPVVGMERPLPGHRPRLLARRRPAPWPTSPTG